MLFICLFYLQSFVGRVVRAKWALAINRSRFDPRFGRSFQKMFFRARIGLRRDYNVVVLRWITTAIDKSVMKP